MSASANVVDSMQLTGPMEQATMEQVDTEARHPCDERSVYARKEGQAEQLCDSAAVISVSCVQKACNSGLSAYMESGASNILRNQFDLKLEAGSTSRLTINAIEWTVSPVECSPSSSSSDDEKRLLKSSASHDSGFSSDDNSPKRSPPQRTKLERSVTLPSALRAPSRTRSQKSVRFADSLGLDLEQKNFFDEDDWCEESHSYSYPTLSMLKSNAQHDCYAPNMTALSLVAANFQIRSEAEATHLARTQCVCLRSLSICDMNITGLIDVLNLAFEKQVCVRYSLNDWMSFEEAAAVYLSAHGNDGAVDSFSFSINLPKNLPLRTACHFCIRYTVNGTSHWDNNNNSNFVLLCAAKETETKNEKALRNSRRERLFSSTHSYDGGYDRDLRPIWPDYCPEIEFPRFKAGGWRRHKNTLPSSEGPRFY
ncbi:Protein phosphatase 1 regulatory subunit 3D [Toxocara canis]|uniref:Protein phosphatase 1 regulatory subunit 3D n=1 Tax=Toxocara canis TaxID=6265 RepID=A0A0B2VL87_TOXCA|nr:Protein phosphatase 1 regulatory subunit 3D [Toxocara canis]